MSVGIALPIIQRGFHSAKKVVNLHQKHTGEVGEVYFSTNNRIDPNKGKSVDYVLLVSNTFKFIAEFVSYEYFEDKGNPSDVIKYSPKEFNQDIDKHWFKIKNIRKIDDAELNQFEMINKAAQEKYNGVCNYVNNSKRLQVFYFRG